MNLSKKLGTMEFDGLFADLNPAAVVGAITIRKEGSEKTTYARGTIVAKSSIDGKCVILGTEAAAAVDGGDDGEDTPAEVLTPYAVLADEVTVDTDEDVAVAAYIAGCFNANKVSVADEYEITDADKDALRDVNIILKAVSAAE